MVFRRTDSEYRHNTLIVSKVQNLLPLERVNGAVWACVDTENNETFTISAALLFLICCQFPRKDGFTFV